MLDGLTVTLVDSLEEAQALLTWLEEQPHVAIDTETAGLQWWRPDFTRLIQFGTETEAYAVGAREWRQFAAQALALVCKRDIPVYMHNAKFDMHALEADGFPVPAWHNVHDTMIMDHLCSPIRSHALKAMGLRTYGKAATVGDQLLKKLFQTTGLDWDTVPVDEPRYWAYGCMDTVLTARFGLSLYAELQERNLTAQYEREMAVQAITYRMESRGMRIDLPYTERLREEWECRMVSLRLQLDAWGLKNPNSNAQLVEVLQRLDNWEPAEFTETGQPKTSKAVLQKIDSRIVPVVLEYKRLQKWTSTYLDHFLGEHVNGHVHPNFRTLGARTGRMSITDPPMQTLPAGDPAVRRCILPYEGDSLWATDYDAQEFRVLAHFTQDPGLLRIIEQGADPHAAVASAVYGVPLADVEPWQRKRSKNVQFAWVYGAGVQKIADTAGLPPEEVDYFVRVYTSQFPKVRGFKDDVENRARAQMLHGEEPHVWTAGGRWCTTEPDKLYPLVNYIIQGSCADLLKMKLVELDKVGLADNVILPVHDELLFSFPEKDLDSADEARHIMEEYELFSVPLTCHTTGPLTSWGDDDGH